MTAVRDGDEPPDCFFQGADDQTRFRRASSMSPGGDDEAIEGLVLSQPE